MSDNTKIQWADATFNPWWGCQKVSAGCEHCYAETLARRFSGGGIKMWGPRSASMRRVTSEKNWQLPLKWDKAAKASGTTRRVFCGSMCDVFEDNPEIEMERDELFGMIDNTPNLIWMLLTKRPQNIMRMIPRGWVHDMPRNVWAMTTIENNAVAYERIQALLAVPAVVHGVSCEPLLGEVDLALHWGGIDWVIAGGESGPGARPMDPAWAQQLRDDCVEHHVPFFFKQWGNWFPRDQWEGNPELVLPDDCDAYTNRPGQIYQVQENDHVVWHNVGKKKAGRLLDGREWNEIPEGR